MVYSISWFKYDCLCCVYVYSVFVVMLKVAYGVRIIDWSSDVCSSDHAIADAYPAIYRLPIDNRFVTGSLNRGYGTGINFPNTRNFGFTGTVDIDLGGPALKSITAYRNLDTRFGHDLANSPVVGFEGSFRVKQHQFSEELQLSGKAFNDKLDYLVGAYYFSEGGRESEDVAFAGGLFQIVGNFRFNTKSYALFTHLNYRVNDLLGITLGGRRSEERSVGKECDSQCRSRGWPYH